MHRRTRLPPLVREEIYQKYKRELIKVTDLAEQYHVSRPTIYKIIGRGKQKDYRIHKSTNVRYRTIQYGLKRLDKIEKQIEDKLKRQAKRYNKKYPGEMIHVDTKRLPLLVGEATTESREYLFVGIDDFSRELYAAILPDKTQYSAEAFLEQMVDECPYTIEQIYSDNGKEYKGAKDHAFMVKCMEYRIEQRFTKVKTPRTNGKAERVIRTIMEMWHNQEVFNSRAHRKTSLNRFINYYNTVKPHKGIDNLTPIEQLTNYFYPQHL